MTAELKMKVSTMKIIFMGTPEFAAESLENLYNVGHNIVGVFTQPDKPKNRGMKTTFSPVKLLAMNHNTPIYQPLTLKDDNIVNIIKELQCDLIVVVAYGKKIPNEILSIPPLGCINIHASILPKYRGASPIQHAIINGDTETGVTSQYMSEEIDAGEILLVKKIAIDDNDTSVDLFSKLSTLGAKLLIETISAIEAKTIMPTPQNENDVTYASLLTKDMSPIDWSKTAHEIKCMVRGLQPWPTATMILDEKTIKIFSVDITSNKTSMIPGNIVSHGQNGIEIACSDGTVIIKELQAPGGKRMNAADFLKGNPIIT